MRVDLRIAWSRHLVRGFSDVPEVAAGPTRRRCQPSVPPDGYFRGTFHM